MLEDTDMEFPYQQNNNIPFMLTQSHFHQQFLTVSLADQVFHKLSSINNWSRLLNTTDNNNNSLKPAQKEIKLWHQKLGHCDVIERDARCQIIIPNMKQVSSCLRPICAAC